MFSTWFILNIPGTCIFDSNNFLFYKAFFIYFRRPKKTLKIIKMKITVEKSSTKKSFSEWFDLFNLLLSINIYQYFLLFIFLPNITFPEEVIYTLWGIMKLHFFCRDTMSPNTFFSSSLKRKPLYVQRFSWNEGHLFFWVLQNNLWCISI